MQNIKIFLFTQLIIPYLQAKQIYICLACKGCGSVVNPLIFFLAAMLFKAFLHITHFLLDGAHVTEIGVAYFF